MTVEKRTAFLPPGESIATKCPTLISEQVNLPPLLEWREGEIKINSDKYESLPYGVDDGFKKRKERAVFSKYGGFTLHVQWGHEAFLDFDKIYFMAKFFSDVKDLGFSDKTLLNIYVVLALNSALEGALSGIPIR